ncbi:EthD family reductase [Gimesia algae]|uniref:EthD protein n=1 Tax=Gimesia algae TaxID=2527971 RepID=A0A517VGT4_9PLAN|nr:EthD family reductase [Gimesia algae]QDT92210.1 EthD protein [Gimesia algae]
MYRLTVLYGHPDDPAEFDRYYHEVHVPLAKQMKGLTGWTIGKCISAEAGSPPPYYLIASLYAESAAGMQAVLESPEGQATIADVSNFATGGVMFMYDEEEVLIPLHLQGS